MADSPSRSELFGSFHDLSERLDFIDAFIQALQDAGPGGGYDDSIADDTLGVLDPAIAEETLVSLFEGFGFPTEQAESTAAGPAGAILGSIGGNQPSNDKEAIRNAAKVLAIALAFGAMAQGQAAALASSTDADSEAKALANWLAGNYAPARNDIHPAADDSGIWFYQLIKKDCVVVLDAGSASDAIFAMPLHMTVVQPVYFSNESNFNLFIRYHDDESDGEFFYCVLPGQIVEIRPDQSEWNVWHHIPPIPEINGVYTQETTVSTITEAPNVEDVGTPIVVNFKVAAIEWVAA